MVGVRCARPEASAPVSADLRPVSRLTQLPQADIMELSQRTVRLHGLPHRIFQRSHYDN